MRDGLALHLDLEGHRRREPGLRHDRQDALYVAGKMGRKRCHQGIGDVRRIPRQLHNRRISGGPLGLSTARLNVAGQPLKGVAQRRSRPDSATPGMTNCPLVHRFPPAWPAPAGWIWRSFGRCATPFSHAFPIHEAVDFLRFGVGHFTTLRAKSTSAVVRVILGGFLKVGT